MGHTTTYKGLTRGQATLATLVALLGELVGFDIVTRGGSPAGDRGYAALSPVGLGASGFYSVNLDTGKATRIGTIDRGVNVEGLAIPIGQR